MSASLTTKVLEETAIKINRFGCAEVNENAGEFVEGLIRCYTSVAVRLRLLKRVCQHCIQVQCGVHGSDSIPMHVCRGYAAFQRDASPQASHLSDHPSGAGAAHQLHVERDSIRVVRA